MLSQKMQAALNEQINAESYSAYLYLSMGAYFESLGLNGFAAWMGAQAREEVFHAFKIYTFINDRGGRVRLKAIEAPPTEWASPLAAFQDALAHEQKVTGLINSLVDMSREEKDHASDIFLQWFVTEQVEEEDSVGDVVLKLKLIGDEGNALFMMDKELGLRTVSPAAAAIMSMAPAPAA
ncbi:MAG: ferritin [Pseudomonadota bacterium]